MIQEVNEIPQPIKNPKSDKPEGYYRKLVNYDITDAYLRRLSKFELIGYDAKADYLVGVAKDEGYKVCEALVFRPAKEYAQRILKEEFDEKDIRVRTPGKFSHNPVFKVHGVTLEDGVKHVFCEIDFNAIEAFKENLVAPSRELTKEHIAMERRRKVRQNLSEAIMYD